MAPSFDIQEAGVQALLNDCEIVLDLTNGAKQRLVRLGYHPVHGGGRMKRALRRSVQDPLAEVIFVGNVPNGSTVSIDEGAGDRKTEVVR